MRAPLGQVKSFDPCAIVEAKEQQDQVADSSDTAASSTEPIEPAATIPTDCSTYRLPFWFPAHAVSTDWLSSYRL